MAEIDMDTVTETLEEIRTALQSHGGDLEFVEMRDGNVVVVRLRGACAGCPGARNTIKMGVERRLKEVIPEIAAVEAVNFEEE